MRISAPHWKLTLRNALRSRILSSSVRWRKSAMRWSASSRSDCAINFAMQKERAPLKLIFISDTVHYNYRV